MFSNTIVGNIAHLEVAVHEGREFLTGEKHAYGVRAASTKHSEELVMCGKDFEELLS